MNELQRNQLDLLISFAQVCSREKIPFTLLAGTFLGAVRHKGFIPWDDDVDVGLLRSDYDRFLEIAPNYLPKDVYLQSFEKDPRMPLPYTKLRLDGTQYEEEATKNVDWHRGIFIDIFPLDGSPDNSLPKFWHALSVYAKKRLIMLKQGVSLAQGRAGIASTLVLFFAKVLARAASLAWLRSSLGNQMRKYDTSLGHLVVCGGSYGYLKERVPYDWLFPTSDYEFEGQLFPGPGQAHQYLENLYGDYMTPPPKKLRVGRHMTNTTSEQSR